MIKLLFLIENIDADVAQLKSKLEKTYDVITGLRYDPRGYIRPGHIIVPPDKRSSGVGTKVMNDLIKFADEKNIPILIEPSNEFGGNLNRLYTFYSRFGFVKQKSGNKMYRLPTKVH